MGMEGGKFKRELGGWEAVSNHDTTITITVPITTPTVLFSITYRVSVPAINHKCWVLFASMDRASSNRW